MPSLLADVNCGGHLDRLLRFFDTDGWSEFWIDMGWSIATYEELGLPGKTPDDSLWHLCQAKEIVLLTNNRNNKGADSLESTIRQFNHPTSWPIITIGDGKRFMKDSDYAVQVARKTIDFLFRIDELRGTGRLYVP